MIDKLLLSVDPNKILDRIEAILNWIEKKQETSPFTRKAVKAFDDLGFKLVLWAMGQKNLNLDD